MISKQYSEKIQSLPSVRKEDYTTYNVFDNEEGEVVHRKITKDELSDLGFPGTGIGGIQATHGKYIVTKYVDDEAYKEARKENSKMEGEIIDEFKQALFDDNGYEQDSKVAEVIFSEAWEDGHSSGLKEVEQHFYDYDEFAQDILKASR